MCDWLTDWPLIHLAWKKPCMKQWQSMTDLFSLPKEFLFTEYLIKGFHGPMPIYVFHLTGKIAERNRFTRCYLWCQFHLENIISEVKFFSQTDAQHSISSYSSQRQSLITFVFTFFLNIVFDPEFGTSQEWRPLYPRRYVVTVVADDHINGSFTE